MGNKQVVTRDDATGAISPSTLLLPGCGAVVGELMGALHTALTAVLPGNGTLYLSPVIYERSTIIDRLYANVTVVGDTTSVIRMGLYPDLNGSPDLTYDPVAAGTDYGTVATTSLGLVFVAAAKTVTPGRWWHAGVQQGAPTTRATYTMHTPGATQNNPIAAPTTLAGGARFKTGVTGALPVLGSLAALDNANCLRVWSRPTT